MKTIGWCSEAGRGLLEDDFADQWISATEACFSTFLLNQEQLDEGNYRRAVRNVEHEGTAIYRGWMVTVEQYEKLYQALVDRGARLINSPAEYRHCHFLPEYFDIIQDRSPKTVWAPLTSEGVNVDAVDEAASVFGDAPVIIKDYVKSRKHEWKDACFVPMASDKDRLRRVV